MHGAIFDEGRLLRINDEINFGGQSSSKNFHNDFVNLVYQTNRTEVANLYSAVVFKSKSNECIIESTYTKLAIIEIMEYNHDIRL